MAALCRALPWLEGELRSDHAGETGAVLIYRGILAVTRNAELRAFAQNHLRTEQHHLALISAMLPKPRQSWLLPGWRLAGFITGALPALFGKAAVYATIDAVESFVDHHYAQQITRLAQLPEAAALHAVLSTCQADEIAHRDEARAASNAAPGLMLRGWMALVGGGSQAAVMLARLI